VSKVLEAVGLKIVPNLFLSIQTCSGYKYCLAMLEPSTSEVFVSGFDEERNLIVAFPREQVLMIEFYSTLDEENKWMQKDKDAL
jgi:hypothetical protein